MLAGHVGLSVRYRRGTTELTLPATVGRTVFRLNDEYGAVERRVSRNYLVRVEDLTLAGETVEPRPGDRIVEGRSIHEVMAPGGEPAWRMADPHGVIFRIHTKYVGQEPAE